MNTSFCANPEVMYTDLGNEIILVHGGSGHSYRLNVSARLAWLELPTTPTQLAATLAARFDVDVQTAHRDALITLEEFAANKLAFKSG